MGKHISYEKRDWFRILTPAATNCLLLSHSVWVSRMWRYAAVCEWKANWVTSSQHLQDLSDLKRRRSRYPVQVKPGDGARPIMNSWIVLYTALGTARLLSDGAAFTWAAMIRIRVHHLELGLTSSACVCAQQLEQRSLSTFLLPARPCFTRSCIL